jgi:hypothetical protein
LIGVPDEELAADFAGAELPAGAEVTAGAEFAAAAELTGGAIETDFLLLVVEAGVSAIADELAGVVDCMALSLAAAFLLLRLVFDAVASDVLVAGADWSVAVVPVELFELDFFLLAADEVPPAEESELAPVSDCALDFFLLAVDLVPADEVSADKSELVAASDLALFVDFLLEDLVPLEAAD